MRKALTYILTLMLMACSSSSEEPKSPQEDQQPVLSLYVYAPEHPMMTRGNIGETTASEQESKVTRLQIWVFEHSDGKFVAYYEPTSTDNLNGVKGGDVYQVPVSRDFATRRPRVDVYVLANVTETNTGKVYNKNTPLEDLKAAPLDDNHFGTSPLTIEVPSDGLPMSGVLLNQPITGESPVLRIGTDYSEMATVRLVRMVSKMHFVFGALSGSDVTITGVSIDANQLASVEYMFLEGPYTGRNSHIWSYVEAPVTLRSSGSPLSVNMVADPLEYIFVDGVEDAQDYEDRINNAVSEKTLSSIGPFYLHESDKQLTGTINYKVNGNDMDPVKFVMAEEGDFSRNHTWLVYAYYGDAVLEFNIVDVNSWTDKDVRNHDVYNW